MYPWHFLSLPPVWERMRAWFQLVLRALYTLREILVSAGTRKVSSNIPPSVLSFEKSKRNQTMTHPWNQGKIINKITQKFLFEVQN